METDYSAGDRVVYKKPLDGHRYERQDSQCIPAIIKEIYPSGKATIQPLNPTIGKKVVKLKYLELQA